MDLPKTLEQSVAQLKKLPGVGERSALRLSLAILDWEKDSIEDLSEGIKNLLNLKKCNVCNSLADQDVCELCLDTKRYETSMLCVVESMTDLLAIENSGEFDGTYFVLGGVLNPLKGVGPEQIGISKLVKKVVDNDIKNIVLAINPSIEGDATCSYINEILPEDVKVDRIGFGVPIGGSLEYLDSMTISQALKNRKAFL